MMAIRWVNHQQHDCFNQVLIGARKQLDGKLNGKKKSKKTKKLQKKYEEKNDG